MRVLEVTKIFNKPVTIFVLATLGGFFLSQPTYASDISISNSGKVSFGKVQPSSIGTLVTGEDELSISTTCSEGVNVYATSVNGNDTGTSLVNLATKAQDTEGTNAASYTINTSSATIGSAATLADNTWGLNTNASEAGNGLYYGLPAFSDSTTPTAIYTGTDSSIPVYFGAKVTNTLATGTYNGQVLYTVTVNTACLNYTVTFNKNAEGASGTMENQTILPAGGNLRVNSFEYSGYTFLGWSTSPAGKTGTAVNGIGTEADVEYENEALFPDATTSPDIKPGDDVTLYAIWKKNIVYMQDWATTEFGCSKLQPNEIVTLVDSRDNHEYKVKKLPDGKCWMIQNLTLSATDLVTEGKALTSANTNIPSSDTNSYYVPPKNTRYATANSITNSAVATASTSVNFDYNYSNHPQVGYRAKGTTDNNRGNPVPEDTAYYNFYTATLGFSYYNDGRYSGSSPRDICPKGWRLPWVSDSGSTASTSGYFQTLMKAYNPSASWTNSNTASNYYTSDATIRKNMILGDSGSLDPTLEDNSAAGFTYAGFYSSTVLYNVGTAGRYWSSSVYSSSDGYGLSFNTSLVYPQDLSTKYDAGLAVRCVTDNISGYMQDFDSSTLADGATTTLIDKRDDNQYTVKKFGSGDDTEVWMTSNLTLGYDQTNSVAKGLTLTSTDTNIPDDTTYYLPPAGMAGSITNPDTVVNPTAGAIFDSNNEPYAKVQYLTTSQTGSTNPQPTGYYNFSAASLGYSGYNSDTSSGDTPRDICPTGWQLPRDSSASSYSFYWLDRALGGTSYNRTGDTTTIDRYVNDFALSYHGYYTRGTYYNTTELNGVDSQGYWWSSTILDTNNSHALHIYSNGNIYPQDAYAKYNGYAVRCVAKPPSYIINYNGNGGTGNMASSKGYIGGSILSKNIFTKNDYYFLGWSTDPSATTATYNSGGSITDDLAPAGGSVTLYAVWSDTPPYCSSDIHPYIGVSNACRMPNDGRQWFMGNKGNATKWNANTLRTWCPGGNVPTKTDYDNLRSRESNSLYNLLGLTSTRKYWSSTESGNTYYAYAMTVGASNSSTSDYVKDSFQYYILCIE